MAELGYEMGLISIAAIGGEPGMIACFDCDTRKCMPEAQNACEQFGRQPGLRKTHAPELAHTQPGFACYIVEANKAAPLFHPSYGALYIRSSLRHLQTRA